MPERIVLAIETSCDETAVAILRGSTLLTDASAAVFDRPEILQAHLQIIAPRVDFTFLRTGQLVQSESVLLAQRVQSAAHAMSRTTRRAKRRTLRRARRARPAMWRRVRRTRPLTSRKVPRAS